MSPIVEQQEMYVQMRDLSVIACQSLRHHPLMPCSPTPENTSSVRLPHVLGFPGPMGRNHRCKILEIMRAGSPSTDKRSAHSWGGGVCRLWAPGIFSKPPGIPRSVLYPKTHRHLLRKYSHAHQYHHAPPILAMMLHLSRPLCAWLSQCY